MYAGPLHDGRSAARLLAAATLFDLLVVVFLTKLLGSAAVEFAGFPPDPVFYGGLFVVLFLVSIVIVELMPGGKSLGRMCLGLRVRDSGGGRLDFGARLARMFRRLVTLGLGGLNVNQPAYWDRASRVVWASPMAPRPISDWRLAIRNGSRKDEVLILGSLPGWDTPKRAIKIGRDPSWADLALPRDGSVSGRHAVLMSRDNELRVLDYGTNGNGSTHGTFVDGRRVPPGAWGDLTGAEQFEVGSVRIRIIR